MSYLLKPRVVEDGYKKRWIKGGFKLINRRAVLFSTTTFISVMMTCGLMNIWGLFYLSMMLPVALFFWVPSISDKSEDISVVSVDNLMPMVKYSFKVSILFFLFIVAVMSIGILLISLFSMPGYETIDLPIKALKDTSAHPVILMVSERVSTSFTFVSFFILYLVFIFYTMLYSGMSGRDSFNKLAIESSLNGSRLLLLFQVIVMFSFAVMMITLTVSSLFDSIYIYILSIMAVMYSYSLTIAVSYMAFKDIYLGGGTVDEVKVKVPNIKITGQTCHSRM